MRLALITTSTLAFSRNQLARSFTSAAFSWKKQPMKTSATNTKSTVTTPSERMEFENRDFLVENLLSDRSYDIEFNGYLSNHAKHAIVALWRLNAPKFRIQEYWDEYTKQTPYGLSLHPIAPSSWEDNSAAHCRSEEEWAELRGKKQEWTSMVNFLQRELQSTKFNGDIQKLVAHYAPPILPGLAGALTHGIIHLGWAVDANNPWMILEGLAYMNFSFLSVLPEQFRYEQSEEHDNAMSSLQHVAKVWDREHLDQEWISKAKEAFDETSGFHSELIPAGFQWQLSKVLHQQHEVAYTLPRWLDTMTVDELFEELYKTATLLYLATATTSTSTRTGIAPGQEEKEAHGNFVVLHLITSLWGLEHALKLINDETVSRNGLKYYYVTLINLLATSAGGFPSAPLLELTLAEHKNNNDESNPLEYAEEWKEIFRRGIAEEEEHNIKLVYVAKELWQRYHYWSGFRKAGALFTLTPNIGPSTSSFKA